MSNKHDYKKYIVVNLIGVRIDIDN